ncbi:Uncharacterised protein [Enterobacter cloacae]|nr:Uncharacterised protein [Enterobacter cloacae]
MGRCLFIINRVADGPKKQGHILLSRFIKIAVWCKRLHRVDIAFFNRFRQFKLLTAEVVLWIKVHILLTPLNHE